MTRYRRKETFEASQWHTGDPPQPGMLPMDYPPMDPPRYRVPTHAGSIPVFDGDWITTHDEGETYSVCPATHFDERYELAE